MTVAYRQGPGLDLSFSKIRDRHLVNAELLRKLPLQQHQHEAQAYQMIANDSQHFRCTVSVSNTVRARQD